MGESNEITSEQAHGLPSSVFLWLLVSALVSCSLSPMQQPGGILRVSGRSDQCIALSAPFSGLARPSEWNAHSLPRPAGPRVTVIWLLSTSPAGLAGKLICTSGLWPWWTLVHAAHAQDFLKCVYNRSGLCSGDALERPLEIPFCPHYFPLVCSLMYFWSSLSPLETFFFFLTFYLFHQHEAPWEQGCCLTPLTQSSVWHTVSCLGEWLHFTCTRETKKS